MPLRSLRSCAYPGCPNLVRSGYCSGHEPVGAATNKPVEHKLYDRTWQKVRIAQLAREPWCADCLEAGIYTPATEVHHERRHRGDPVIFRTSPKKSLCKSCHSKRTREEIKNAQPG